MRKIKVFNNIFTDAWYSFSFLKMYHSHITALMHRSIKDVQEFRKESEMKGIPKTESTLRAHRDFDKIYGEIYPSLFNNSFLISACALFEYQIKKICVFVKEEHKVPLEWDDMIGSVPKRAKRFLVFAGIKVKDDPEGSFKHWYSSLSGQGVISIDELWQELGYYFMIRNCLTHHNGQITKLRNAQRIEQYATEKKIITDHSGSLELSLNDKFNSEVCDNMEKFFQKLMSAYYGTPLPE